MKVILNIFLALLLLCAVGVVPIYAESYTIHNEPVVDYRRNRDHPTDNMTFEELEQYAQLKIMDNWTIEKLVERELKIEANRLKLIKDDGVPAEILDKNDKNAQAAYQSMLEKLPPDEREAYSKRDELVQQELLKRKSSVSE